MANAHDDPTRLQSWLDAIAEIGAALNEQVSLTALLDLVAKTACELMHYDFCAVLIPDDAHRVLLIAGAFGLSAEYIEGVNATNPIALRPGELEAPSSRAFLTQDAVQVTDILEDPAFVPWGGVAREQGFQSMIAVPVVVSGIALGTLNCYVRERHHFPAAEIDLLTMLANQVGNAVTTAQLRATEAETIKNLHGLNTSLEEQRDLLRQGEAIHQRLTALALHGGGLHAVADALADLLDRSLVAEDAEGKEILAVPRGRRPASVPPATLRSRELREMLESVGSSSEPVQVPADATDAPVFTVPVVLENEVVARFWFDGYAHDLTALDRRAIEHAVTVSALEMWRARTAMEVEWRLSGEIVTAVVTGNDAATVVPRAARLGHDLHAPHAVLVFRSDTTDDEEFRRRVIAALRTRADIYPRPLVAPVEGRVVALWPVNGPDVGEAVAVADTVRRTLATSRAATTAVAAVTGPASTVGDYPRLYAIARGLAELSSLRGVTDQTLGAEDLGLHSLLLQIDDLTELTRFTDAVLGPLRDYDKRHGTVLLETLACYVDADLSTSTTAASLFVHPNTVAQRLRRIEEVGGISLSNIRTVAKVVIALASEEVSGVQGFQRGRTNPE
ncbi:helix-turn-helix domain-containing protein [Rhodococcus koreensis]